MSICIIQQFPITRPVTTPGLNGNFPPMKHRQLLGIALLCALSMTTLGELPLQAQVSPPGNAIPPAPSNWQQLPGDKRVTDLKKRRLAPLKEELAAHGFHLGNAAFIRIFKETSELELWLKKSKASTYTLFKTYPIARWSGELGPKLQEGDGQAPEGFYDVVQKRLNPNSKYHLAFNIGYPNAHDTAHHRTGNFIMIHGKDVSIGCFAMTDPVIEELYLIVEAALTTGQKTVLVHCFPFRITDERLAQAKTDNSPWGEFWTTLQPIWQAFEKNHLPPKVLQGKAYALKK